MISTQICRIEWLETIVAQAKSSGLTHFRIIPIGSCAGFEFCAEKKSMTYSPSVEDMSITGDEWTEYLCNEKTWDEYMEIRTKTMMKFYGLKGDEE